jgi:hypothetical protein
MMQRSALRPAALGPSTSFFLRKFNEADDMSSTLNLAKKNDVSPDPTQNPTTMVAEKIRSIVFYPKILFLTHFYPKHLKTP